MAASEDDYDLCDELCKAEGVRRSMISFPTIMAFDGEDQSLIGFLGTRVEKKMIIAGPLVIKSGRRRIFTALRLCEAYEMSMLNIGISSFIFHVESGSLLDRAIKRYYPSMEPYAVQDGGAFYIWRMTNERRSQGSSAQRGGASTSGGPSGTA